MAFSNREYADIVFCYGFSNGNSRSAQREYINRYPTRRVPDVAVFNRTFLRLTETGSIRVSRSSAGAPGGTGTADEAILRQFEDDPRTSTRVVALR